MIFLSACTTPTPTLTPETPFSDTLFPDTPSPTLTVAPRWTATIPVPPSPTPENVLAIPRPLHDLRWSADGSRLAIAAGTDIHLYNANLAEEHVIPLGLWTERIAFHPAQPILGAALKDGSIRFWESASGAEICQFNAHSKGANSLAFQPGGILLASTGTEIVSRMWDISSVLAGGCDVQPIAKLIGSSFTTPDVSFSPDGQWLALVDIKDIYLHNSQTRKLIVILHGDLAIFDIALSPDGHWLAAAQNDSTITLWDLTAKPKPTSILLRFPQSKPNTYTWRVDFNAESNLLTGATSVGELLVWALPNLQPVFNRSLGHPISGLAFNPATSALTVGTLNGAVYIYMVK